MTSKPVHLTTGEKFLNQTDFQTAGAYGLSLGRTYRSQKAVGSMFGANWLSSFDWPRLVRSPGQNCDADGVCLPTYVVFRETDGSQFSYKPDPASVDLGIRNKYSVAGSASLGRLTYSYTTRGWSLSKAGRNHNFNSSGQITSIYSISGELLYSFAYTSGLVTKVTNTVGQSISFVWQNSKVVQVIDPSGQTWNYAYDANGMLSTVTSPGASPDVRTYYYENSADRTLLTGVAVNGVRYSTYQYYADKRVNVSGLAGGEEVDTISYGTNSATVTDAYGKSQTYSFTSIGGELRTTAVSRAAGSNCPAAAAQTVYNASNFVDYTVDWNGVKTRYAYDTYGRPTQVTEAADTADARITSTTWPNTLSILTPSTVTLAGQDGVAFQRTAYNYYPSGSGFSTNRISSIVVADLLTGSTRTTSYAYTFYANGSISGRTETRDLPTGAATTTYAYDTAGNLTSMQDPVGNQWSWAGYNGLGLPGSSTDPNGVVTNYAYDVKGNRLSQTLVLGTGNRTTAYTYDNNHLITDVNLPDGSAQRFRYTASLRLLKVGDKLSDYVETDIDVPNNRVTTVSNRAVPYLSGGIPSASLSGTFTSTLYRDTLGRPWKLVGNNGQQTVYGYDNNGALTSTVDAAGRTTTVIRDNLGRVIK